MPSEAPQDNEPIYPEEEFKGNRKPKSFRDWFLDLYYKATPLFHVNIAWFLLCLPVLTILPSMAGLYYAVLNHNKENNTNWSIFWEGVKKHWLSSLQWGAILILGDLLLALNIWISLNTDEAWSPYTLTVGILVAIIWFAINQFSFPLLLIQEEKKILLAFRNAYVVAVRRPWDTLKVMVLNILITAVSILIPPLWIFISMALITNIQTRTTLKAVEKIRSQDAERDAADAQRERNEPKGE